MIPDSTSENNGLSAATPVPPSLHRFLVFVRKTWFVWILLNAYNFSVNWNSYFSHEHLVLRDVSQFYLSAKAMDAGISHYTSIARLRAALFGVRLDYQDYPNPYPPTTIFFLSIIAVLPFEVFNVTFDLLYIFSLFGCAHLLIALALPSERSKFLTLGLGAMLMCSTPCRYGFLFGQFDPFILLFMLLGFSSLANGKDVRAGAYFCFGTSIKIFGWPLLVASGLRSRKTSIGAILCGAVLLALTALNFDFAEFPMDYSKSVSESIRSVMPSRGNQSAFSLFFKLRDRSEIEVTKDGEVHWTETLVTDSSALKGAMVLVTLLTLALAIWSTTWRDSYAAGVWLVAANIVLSPLVWGFYYLLCLPFVLDVWMNEKSKLWQFVLLVFCFFAFVADAPHIADYYAAFHIKGPAIALMTPVQAVIPALPLLILAGLVVRSGFRLRKRSAVNVGSEFGTEPTNKMAELNRPESLRRR